jgi:cytochrome c peroxidase
MVMADPDSTDQPVDEESTAPVPRKWTARRLLFVLGVLAFGVVAAVAFRSIEGASPAAAAPGPAHLSHGQGHDDDDANAALIKDGKQTFRFDTFGDEPFWTGTLQLDKAIEGAANGGVGAGVSPATALAVGLKVDSSALPASVKTGIKNGTVDLNDPATTLALLKLNAVVGVKGTFNSAGNLQAVGIECALCHSTVDNSFAPGIGNRLDGWANRDLNVGTIIGLSPNLTPIANLLHTDVPTVKKVLAAWGPGKFDAELFLDGKGFQPDGRSAATLIPPAFGLAGVNLHTWTGWGSVPYWNAFVAILEMHGQGNFTDARLDNAAQFPIAAENHFGHVRTTNDLVSPKLPALQAYQLSLAAPEPPKGSFDPKAAALGKALFSGKANCASCHIAPTFTEPGENLHSGSEIGIDNFEADRSPTHMYRTSPLAGLWTHQKGGFYHDGRFPDLLSVVKHYNDTFNLNLTPAEENDLVQYLLSL